MRTLALFLLFFSHLLSLVLSGTCGHFSSIAAGEDVKKLSFQLVRGLGKLRLVFNGVADVEMQSTLHLSYQHQMIALPFTSNYLKDGVDLLKIDNEKYVSVLAAVTNLAGKVTHVGESCEADERAVFARTFNDKWREDLLAFETAKLNVLVAADPEGGYAVTVDFCHLNDQPQSLMIVINDEPHSSISVTKCLHSASLGELQPGFYIVTVAALNSNNNDDNKEQTVMAVGARTLVVISQSSSATKGRKQGGGGGESRRLTVAESRQAWLECVEEMDSFSYFPPVEGSDGWMAADLLQRCLSRKKEGFFAKSSTKIHLEGRELMPLNRNRLNSPSSFLGQKRLAKNSAIGSGGSVLPPFHHSTGLFDDDSDDASSILSHFLASSSPDQQRQQSQRHQRLGELSNADILSKVRVFFFSDHAGTIKDIIQQFRSAGAPAANLHCAGVKFYNGILGKDECTPPPFAEALVQFLETGFWDRHKTHDPLILDFADRFGSLVRDNYDIIIMGNPTVFGFFIQAVAPEKFWIRLAHRFNSPTYSWTAAHYAIRGLVQSVKLVSSASLYDQRYAEYYTCRKPFYLPYFFSSVFLGMKGKYDATKSKPIYLLWPGGGDSNSTTIARAMQYFRQYSSAMEEEGRRGEEDLPFEIMYFKDFLKKPRFDSMNDFVDVLGIFCLPYSLLSAHFNEVWASGIPLIVPSVGFINREFQTGGGIDHHCAHLFRCDVPSYSERCQPFFEGAHDPNSCDEQNVWEWMHLSDFGSIPGTLLFDSLPHALDLMKQGYANRTMLNDINLQVQRQGDKMLKENLDFLMKVLRSGAFDIEGL